MDMIQRIKAWFKSSRHKPTLAKIFLSYMNAMKEKDCMSAYVRSNLMGRCDDPLYHEIPSIKLRRLYNLDMSKINSEVWWLLEQYFKGNLVLKQEGKKTNKKS